MDEATSVPAQRNIKLDFFRGIALLIIFVNHVPGNDLLLYTPSRFGLSDAAEIFVFLSGYAAAIAYGRSFRSAGLAMGSFRVFHRCVHIYAAHLALFVAMAMVCVLGNAMLDTRDYIDHLNIRYFFDHTEIALLNLVSLRYVPNYFDILPLYLVVMLWIPAVWVLSRVHPLLALGFSLGIYLAMWRLGLELPADPTGDRPWFFNPFGWQLIFFIGFAFGSGWLKPPAPNRWLIGASVLVIVAALPFSPEPALRPSESLQQMHALLQPWLEKTRFGPLRLLHFLAASYLAHTVLGTREHWLLSGSARAIVQMGRISLPLFMVTMVASYVGGMAFDVWGHDLGSIVAINAAGAAGLLLVARVLTWIGSSPWKQAALRGGLQTSASGGAAGWRLMLPSGVSVKALAAGVLLSSVTVLPLLLARAPSDAAAHDPLVMNLGLWIDDAEIANVPSPPFRADFAVKEHTEVERSERVRRPPRSPRAGCFVGVCADSAGGDKT